jgi:hypothetical protein
MTPDEKYVCENCDCGIDESLLLGYEDETRGLCKDCRIDILAFFANQDLESDDD